MERKDIVLFGDEVLKDIRFLERDGKIWFSGRDVAEALGYKKPGYIVRTHVQKQDVLNLWGERFEEKNGKWEEFFGVNMSGIYSLILASNTPLTKKFILWLKSEVLYQIGRFEVYVPERIVDETLEDNEVIFEKVLEIEQDMERLKLEKRLEEQRKNEKPPF